MLKILDKAQRFYLRRNLARFVGHIYQNRELSSKNDESDENVENKSQEIFEKFAQESAEEPINPKKVSMFTESEEDEFFGEEEDFRNVSKEQSMLATVFRYFLYGSMGLIVAGFIDNKIQERQAKNKKQEKEDTEITDDIYIEKPQTKINMRIPFFSQAAKLTEEFFVDKYEIFTKPPCKKMLLDQPKYPNNFVPKTLVLNLGGTLLYTNYSVGVGFELTKRPGLNYFFSRLSNNFEIVIYSDEDPFFVAEVCEELDPKARFIAGRLGRESHVYYRGKNSKDLGCLNRDLKNVIVLDCQAARVAKNPQNAIIIPEYTPENLEMDRELYDLIPFLEYLSAGNIKDVRKELDKYGHVEGYKKYLREMQKKKRELQHQTRTGMGGAFNALKGDSKK